MSWMNSIVMTGFTLFYIAINGVAAYALLNDPRPGAWIVLLVLVAFNTICWLSTFLAMWETS